MDTRYVIIGFSFLVLLFLIYWSIKESKKKALKVQGAKNPLVDAAGKVRWINMFKTDWFSLLMFAGIIMILIGTSQVANCCRACQTNPCDICYAKTQLEEQQNNIDYTEIQNLNLSAKLRGGADGIPQQVLPIFSRAAD